MGRIFNIQKFSLHDGQGIRTLVFLKGCPLSCRWCSNPEGIAAAPQLAFSPERCIGRTACGDCQVACKNGAVRFNAEEKVEISWDLCDHCGDCVSACPSASLELLGREASATEIMAEIDRDDSFYARSGGGLTISGGEPLGQVDFVLGLLEQARERGLDTAIETSGACSWKALEAVGRRVSRVYYDIKCMDPVLHERFTGISNRRILENFIRLRRRFPGLDLVVRTPVVPGFNDSGEEIGAIVEFVVKSGGATDYELLAYHAYAKSKYERLGRDYPLPGTVPPAAVLMENLKKLAIRARRPGGTFREASRSTA